MMVPMSIRLIPPQRLQQVISYNKIKLLNATRYVYSYTYIVYHLMIELFKNLILQNRPSHLIFIHSTGFGHSISKSIITCKCLNDSAICTGKQLQVGGF